MRIAFYGSSLISSYRNGAATYYRGLIRNLAALGHHITFFEADLPDRRWNRDLKDEPDWAHVVAYSAVDVGSLERALDAGHDADVVVASSDSGPFQDVIERELIAHRRPGQSVVFWDVDPPARLDRLYGDSADPFRSLLSKFDLVFTAGGGDPLIHRYLSLGARACTPVYHAVDPATHHPVAAVPEFEGALSFLGNRLADREERLNELFLRPAALLPTCRFILGGEGWSDEALPPGVRAVGHVPTDRHNAFNCSARAVLNVSSDNMAGNGWLPPPRLFEAAGAAACLITDAWDGIEFFLDPGHECLVANSGDEVAELVRSLDPARAVAIGKAALRRVLAQHTHAHRAGQVAAILEGRLPASRRSARG